MQLHLLLQNIRIFLETQPAGVCLHAFISRNLTMDVKSAYRSKACLPNFTHTCYPLSLLVIALAQEPSCGLKTKLT